jgi:hypothetical protein
MSFDLEKESVADIFHLGYSTVFDESELYPCNGKKVGYSVIEKYYRTKRKSRREDRPLGAGRIWWDKVKTQYRTKCEKRFRVGIGSFRGIASFK